MTFVPREMVSVGRTANSAVKGWLQGKTDILAAPTTLVLCAMSTAAAKW